MQPPPQHPSIRARNAFRSRIEAAGDYLGTSSAAPGDQPSRPRLPDIPSGEPIVAKVHTVGTMPPAPPPRHPIAIGRSQSEPQSIATALRATATAATLAVPSARHDGTSSASDYASPAASRSPSPAPSLGRHRASSSMSRSITPSDADNRRPSVSLYANQMQEEDVAAALDELRQLELVRASTRGSSLKGLTLVPYQGRLPAKDEQDHGGSQLRRPDRTCRTPLIIELSGQNDRQDRLSRLCRDLGLLVRRYEASSRFDHILAPEQIQLLSDQDSPGAAVCTAATRSHREATGR